MTDGHHPVKALGIKPENGKGLYKVKRNSWGDGASVVPVATGIMKPDSPNI